jgi:phenylacetate-coenzyme A ligase PaaK-like adenylate-forming protein
MRAIVHRVLKHQGSCLLKHFDFTTIQAVSINQELLQRLLRDNQDTEYGRKYHFSDIKSIDDYRKNVPMTTYEDYEGYINRMTENGERSLLTNYPIAYYASASGTSGSPKKIPVTDRG